MQYCQITLICYFWPDPRDLVLLHFHDTVASGNVFITTFLFNILNQILCTECHGFINENQRFFIKSHISSCCSIQAKFTVVQKISGWAVCKFNYSCLIFGTMCNLNFVLVNVSVAQFTHFVNNVNTILLFCLFYPTISTISHLPIVPGQFSFLLPLFLKFNS